MLSTSYACKEQMTKQLEGEHTEGFALFYLYVKERSCQCTAEGEMKHLSEE